MASIEVIEIKEDLLIGFIDCPNGYKISSVTLELFDVKKLGKLKSFNRIKILEPLKDYGCLVEQFTKILKSKNWDFDKNDNPYSVLFYKKK